MSSGRLIEPHGGTLINLLVDSRRAVELQAASRTWLSWDLTPRQLCDLELLLNGGFSPLRGFMTHADYESVCASMRLADGTLWPVPVTLDVSEELAQKIGSGAIFCASLLDVSADGIGSLLGTYSVQTLFISS